MEIVKSDERAQEGIHNPYRKSLLEEGVFVNLSVLTAASWVRGFREKMEKAGIRTHIGAPELEGLDPVRLTVVEVPDETRDAPVGGEILVEVDGIREMISASVLYNCIPGRDMCPEVLVSNVPLIGHGGNVPTRGETSHSTFHRPDNA
jgi:hypothetical protein